MGNYPRETLPLVKNAIKILEEQKYRPISPTFVVWAFFDTDAFLGNVWARANALRCLNFDYGRFIDETPDGVHAVSIISGVQNPSDPEAYRIIACRTTISGINIVHEQDLFPATMKLNRFVEETESGKTVEEIFASVPYGSPKAYENLDPPFEHRLIRPGSQRGVANQRAYTGPHV